MKYADVVPGHVHMVTYAPHTTLHGWVYAVADEDVMGTRNSQGLQFHPVDVSPTWPGWPGLPMPSGWPKTISDRVDLGRRYGPMVGAYVCSLEDWPRVRAELEAAAERLHLGRAAAKVDRAAKVERVRAVLDVIADGDMASTAYGLGRDLERTLVAGLVDGHPVITKVVAALEAFDPLQHQTPTLAERDPIWGL